MLAQRCQKLNGQAELAAARLLRTDITCSHGPDSWMQSLISFQCGTLVFSSTVVAIFHSRASIRPFSKSLSWENTSFFLSNALHLGDRNLFLWRNSEFGSILMPKWVWHKCGTGLHGQRLQFGAILKTFNSKCCIMAPIGVRGHYGRSCVVCTYVRRVEKTTSPVLLISSALALG